VFLTLAAAVLAMPVGALFGAVGGVCRRLPGARGRYVLACVCGIPVVLTVLTVFSRHTEMRRRIVARFPARASAGRLVALASLDQSERFIWLSHDKEGRAIHLLEGSVHGEMRSPGILRVPNAFAPIHSGRACFAATSTWLAAGVPQGVVIWNHRTREVVCTVAREADTDSTAVALSPDDESVAYAFAVGREASESRQVRVAGVGGSRDSASFNLKATAPVSALAFSPNGKYLAAATGALKPREPTKGGEIAFYDVAERKLKAAVDIRDYFQQGTRRTRQNMSITSLAFHPGAEEHLTLPTVMATVDRRDGAMICYAVDGDRYGTSWSIGRRRTRSAFTSDGYRFAQGYATGYVSVMRVLPFMPMPDIDIGERDWTHRTKVAKLGDPVRLLRFMPDGEHLLANDLVVSVGDVFAGHGPPPQDARRGR